MCDFLGDKESSFQIFVSGREETVLSDVGNPCEDLEDDESICFSMFKNEIESSPHSVNKSVNIFEHHKGSTFAQKMPVIIDRRKAKDIMNKSMDSLQSTYSMLSTCNGIEISKSNDMINKSMDSLQSTYSKLSTCNGIERSISNDDFVIRRKEPMLRNSYNGSSEVFDLPDSLSVSSECVSTASTVGVTNRQYDVKNKRIFERKKYEEYLHNNKENLNILRPKKGKKNRSKKCIFEHEERQCSDQMSPMMAKKLFLGATRNLHGKRNQGMRQPINVRFVNNRLLCNDKPCKPRQYRRYDDSLEKKSLTHEIHQVQASELGRKENLEYFEKAEGELNSQKQSDEVGCAPFLIEGSEEESNETENADELKFSTFKLCFLFD